jgi:hypothetical protein
MNYSEEEGAITLVVDSSHIVAGAVLTQEDEGLQGGKIGAS